MTPPDLPKAWAVVEAAPLAEGMGGQVWRARRLNGDRVVVKRVSAQAASEAAHALAYLNWREGAGAVRLLASDGVWQMLEDAGDQTLTHVLDQDGDAAATLVAAEVLRVLHSPSMRPAKGLQTMTDRFAALTLAAKREGGLFAEADTCRQTLTAEADPVQPLHGDLHHDNILFSARGWLAIDPHGLIGNPAYDAANLLYNPLDRQDLRTDPTRARRLAEVLAPAVGRPVAAVLGYGFCHASLSAAWHLEDGDVAEAERSLAAARAIQAALNAA
ncbi:MAG: aminoglycoside phosphotransferase family protein [Brevundimonas sp.]